MKQGKTRMNIHRISLIVATAFAAFLLVGCSRHEVHAGIPRGPEPYDQRFLTWLVNHHNDDDRIVDPCAKKETIRKELRDFCVAVGEQHRERVDRMRTWLKAWYDKDLPATDNIPLWLGTLNGQDFEREFFREYEHHHADAVAPIKECARTATHTELRELCQRIAPGQERQVAQLRKWRCEWFQDCK